MALTIATNTSSISTQNNLNRTTGQLTKSYKRLSSGLRIVSAADDAAGLAIADSLRADARVAAIAVRNSNDGISLISIADGALNEIGNVLARMSELAEQAANGTLAGAQRSALNAEFLALGSEIQRISQVTQFNDTALLSGSAAFTLQVGLDNLSTSRITFSTVQATLSSLSLGSTAGALTRSLTSQANAQAALSVVGAAIATVASRRGTLGSIESRLNTTVANLQVTRENFLSAESQIRDVDVASEAAELTRLNILQQAGSAVLAQANQQPALALALLGR